MRRLQKLGICILAATVLSAGPSVSATFNIVELRAPAERTSFERTFWQRASYIAFGRHSRCAYAGLSNFSAVTLGSAARTAVSYCLEPGSISSEAAPELLAALLPAGKRPGAGLLPAAFQQGSGGGGVGTTVVGGGSGGGGGGGGGLPGLSGGGGGGGQPGGGVAPIVLASGGSGGGTGPGTNGPPVDLSQVAIAPVPTPAAGLVLLGGLLCLAGLRWRRKT